MEQVSTARRAWRRGLVACVGALVVALVVSTSGMAAVPADAATVYGRITNGYGRCLENLNNAAVANNKIQIDACNTGPAQQWTRQPDGTVRTPAGGCLDVYRGGTASNTAVVLSVCSAATSQQWTAVNNTLVNKRAAKCLQFYGANTNGSWAVVYTCNNSTQQRWMVPVASTPDPPVTTSPVTTSPVTTTPVTTAPVTTTPTAPAATPLWAADLTKPDVVSAGFVDNSWNRELGDGVFNNPTLPWPIKPVAAPGGRAGNAVPFTLPNNAIRLEVEPNHKTFLEGDDAYFGFAFYLGADFPLQTQSWNVIEQLHAAPGTGSPPVSFQAAKGGLLIDGGWGKPGASPATQFSYQQNLMPITTQRWYNVVYHVHFSGSAASSVVDVWVDGAQVLAGFHPPGGTVYAPTPSDDRIGTYRKEGFYHSASIPGGTIYEAGQKYGTSYAAVDPSR